MRAPIRILVIVAILNLMLVDAAGARAVDAAWAHPDTGTFYALPRFNDSTDRPPSIHVSEDRGQAWRRLPSVTDEFGNELPITTFAAIPNGPDAVLLAGTDDHGLFRSTNDGESWSRWNDAAIGIETLSVGREAGAAAWAVSSDGAVYVSIDDGRNWTLAAGVAGRIVTAILAGPDDTAWVGTFGGRLLELDAGTGSVTELNASAFIGLISDLARTDDGTLYVGVDEGRHNGSSLYRTDVADQSRYIPVRQDGEDLQLRGLGAVGNTVYVLDLLEDAIGIGGEPLDFLVTEDGGLTFESEGAPTVYPSQLFAGPCNGGCTPWILLAHAEGMYLKSRSGIGWNLLSPVDEPVEEPPAEEPPQTSSDLGVRMVSPAPFNEELLRDTRRFEILVANNGPDDVAGLEVEVEFTTWEDTSSFIRPENSWGESARIAGEDCQRSRNSFSDPLLVCRLDTLAAGETARIVITETLHERSFQLRIEAEVSANNNRDPSPGNDWNAWEWSVVAEATGGGNPVGTGGGSRSEAEGGGGSSGLLLLLGLLAGVLRQRGAPGESRGALAGPLSKRG